MVGGINHPAQPSSHINHIGNSSNNPTSTDFNIGSEDFPALKDSTSSLEAIGKRNYESHKSKRSWISCLKAPAISSIKTTLKLGFEEPRSENENSFAFFSSVFAPLVPIIGYRAVLGFSGYVINNIAFLLAAVYFYRLSIIIFKDRETAFRASMLFCFNPASIFYSSIYTESLYSLLSLGGIYHLLSGGNTIAVLLFALSGFARSNGVLNAGYICFQAMHQAYDAIVRKNSVGR